MVWQRAARWLVTGLALASAGQTSTARACSCFFAGPGRFYLGTGGTLPSDAVGIPWAGPNSLLTRYGTERPLADRVTLTRRIGERERPEGFTVLRRGSIEFIVPAGGLAPGDVFGITVREYGHWSTPSHQQYRPKREWKKYTPLALPYELSAVVTVTADTIDLRDAELAVSPRARRVVAFRNFQPNCVGRRESDTVDVLTLLPATLEPYRDYLLYETLVDDVPSEDWRSNCSAVAPGRSWTDTPGTNLLFTECVLRDADREYDGAEGTRFGLALGLHTIAMRIRTPDGARTFVTPAQLLELGCDAPAGDVASMPAPPRESAPPPGPEAGPRPSLSAPATVQEPASIRAPRGCRMLGEPGPWWLPGILSLRRRRATLADRAPSSRVHEAAYDAAPRRGAGARTRCAGVSRHP